MNLCFCPFSQCCFPFFRVVNTGERWENLAAFIKQTHDANVIDVPRDGLCFVNSLRKILLCEHGLSVNVPTLMHHLKCAFDKYSDQFQGFFLGQSKELVVKQLDDFFKSGVYNSQAVDLLIGATIMSLGCNVVIYQCYRGEIQSLMYSKDTSKTFVFILQGDHYQPVIRIANTQKQGQQTPSYSHAVKQGSPQGVQQ